jgi:hypothetical protein
MNLACSKTDLELLLAETPFTKHFGFTLVDSGGRLLTHSTVTYIRGENTSGV